MTITPTALITLFKEQLENESKRIAEEHSLAKRGDYLVWWYFLRLHNLLPVDIEESNVDGGGELGLDILRIDDDSVVHFYQFCNPERMERGFPTGDVDKIISGLQLVFSRRHHAVANERLRARIDEIFQTVPSGYKIHLDCLSVTFRLGYRG